MADTKNDLDILFPEVDFKINGETLTIQPFPFCKLPRVVELVSKMTADLFTMFTALSAAKAGDAGENGEVELELDEGAAQQIAHFISNNFSAVAELMAIYCRKPNDFFLKEDIDFTVDDGIALCLTIYAKHYSFFTQRVGPLAAKVRGIKMK